MKIRKKQRPRRKPAKTYNSKYRRTDGYTLVEIAKYMDWSFGSVWNAYNKPDYEEDFALIQGKLAEVRANQKKK